MATATTFSIAQSVAPDFAITGKFDQDSLKEASKQLTLNHPSNAFFNDRGFHNHQAHYILSLLALGASAKQIEAHTKNGENMRTKAPPVNPKAVDSYSNEKNFIADMANWSNYGNYLEFFHQELARKPWQDVVKEYVFSDNEKATIMFNRLYCSVIHPFIHLGAAIEFEQPAMIAEALAWTAVHEGWMDPVFTESAKAASGASSRGEPTDGMASLLNKMHADATLRAAPQPSQADTKRDGVIAHALPQLTQYTSQWRVAEGDVERAAAEVTDAAMYAMAGAQNPRKSVKMDFFLLHSVTSTIALWTFLRQPWLDDATKARIVTWKGRTDLTEYASRACPKLSLEDVRACPPSRSWEELARLAIEDPTLDGHGHKMIRSVMHGAKVCVPYEGDKRMMIGGQDMWLRLCNLALESFKDGQAMFIFGAGFPERWDAFKDRSTTDKL